LIFKTSLFYLFSVVCVTASEADGKLSNGLIANGIPVANGVTPASKSNQRKNTERLLEKDSHKSSHAHTNGSVPKPDEKRLTVNGVMSKPVDRVDDRKSPFNGPVSKSDDRKTFVNGTAQRFDEKKFSSSSNLHQDAECERIP